MGSLIVELNVKSHTLSERVWSSRNQYVSFIQIKYEKNDSKSTRESDCGSSCCLFWGYTISYKAALAITDETDFLSLNCYNMVNRWCKTNFKATKIVGSNEVVTESLYWSGEVLVVVYKKHTCREVSPGLDALRVAGSFPNLPSRAR